MEHRAAAVPARLRRWRSAAFDEKFWLPVAPASSPSSRSSCSTGIRSSATPSVAIAEDNFAARALGLPERNLRMASYALAGAIGGARRLRRRPAAAGLRRQRAAAQLLRLRAGRARRARQQPRRDRRRLRARPVPAGRELPGRRHLLLGRRVRAVHHRAARSRRRACSARPPRGGSDGESRLPPFARVDAGGAAPRRHRRHAGAAADRRLFLAAHRSFRSSATTTGC